MGEEDGEGEAKAVMPTQPLGRRKSKEEIVIQSPRSTKLKLAEESVRQQKQHVCKLNEQNEII